jgi:hypothetical protein
MRPRAASCAVETSEGISSNQDSSDGLRALGAKELGRPADPEADDRGRRRAVTTTSWLGIATVGNGRIARETTLDRYYRCGPAGSNAADRRSLPHSFRNAIHEPRNLATRYSGARACKAPRSRSVVRQRPVSRLPNERRQLPSTRAIPSSRRRARQSLECLARKSIPQPHSKIPTTSTPPPTEFLIGGRNHAKKRIGTPKKAPASAGAVPNGDQL